jgi:probable O-glycosylation ligase (exosortase A-associated)
MRDIVLMLFFLVGLIATFRFPFIGILMWFCFALMNPQQETYSFAAGTRWSLLLAIVTVVSWLASKEPKLPMGGFTAGLVLVLLAWSTINTFFAFDPGFSWGYWEVAWKTIAISVLAGILAVNRVRLHALIWVVAVSLLYYGMKGGLFVLFTGGHNHVMGPPNAMLGDNNTIGIALVMLLPLLNYLRLHSGSRFVHGSLVFAIVLTLAAILGTYSRETYVALGALALAFWWRTKNKLLYPVAAAVVLVPLLMFMPQSFYDRAGTLLQFGADQSFRARLDSWWVAYRYAMDHAPFGAGFYGLNLPSLWDNYIPGEMHAAHSIYFQALGEQGIIGLLLYLLLIFVGFYNLRAVVRTVRGKGEWIWARDLASALGLSLLAFCVGGAAAPMQFFDLLFLWVTLSATMLNLAQRGLASDNVDSAHFLDQRQTRFVPVHQPRRAFSRVSEFVHLSTERVARSTNSFVERLT